MNNARNKHNWFKTNKAYFIRTVTHHYTGRVVFEEEGFVELSDVAWIADDGRFADCLAKGTVSEVEPYPGLVRIAKSALLDWCEWKHALPREQK